MARQQKKKWTAAEWIRFGNRVKRVRNELGSLARDIQGVCPRRNVNALFRIQDKLDHWKHEMEQFPFGVVPEEIITQVFYGDELPEDYQ
jgi:hypothetical protein